MRIIETTQSAAKIFQITRDKESKIVPEFYSKEILSSAVMPIPKQGLAGSEQEAISLANQIGYPVVLKVHSFKITHKSDSKGVLLNLKTDEEVRKGYQDILQNVQFYHPGTKDVMVCVQEMVESGLEVIVGMRRDRVFGPAILFGLGGVWVEILKDVSLRVAPLIDYDLEEMINEIKGSALLGEFRGKPERDITKLKELIKQLENLAFQYPEISEIDLNPVFLYEKGKGALVADARIILADESLTANGGEWNEYR
ncbi:acetyl-CoA synthetase (ADP-forming) beta subunit, branched-chain acyl-CoA synthetase (ADP-forming) beta subunit [Neobacillus bataviensis LMG 21833]|uniref:Acetyl-CoA synthetase (ADP-forming) beta subunit, branched-chain acyl-CoA synthetase (ADP-forming) beta subunit n=1 Tax=Neobacillus bataviensis LMG 21833 TaxID=1117379 RepID=K6D3B9_9BACI|nr:acetate--CoA ligase family protein [Neobacillus bataviensis]EKN66977.1 acetyl-CoA synthetase (ADP-forming) beta subunit, branched-chain acyl-CoA synthetase (ADP-forming) beta subunit [Neobacillus bataviensis LMG 21833]